jgi:hypothetical protein
MDGLFEDTAPRLRKFARAERRPWDEMFADPSTVRTAYREITRRSRR